MIQTQETGKKHHFGPDLGPLDPNLDHQFIYFFIKLEVRHCSKLSFYAIERKTNASNLKKKGEKPNFGTDFELFGPNLDAKFFCGFYLY